MASSAPIIEVISDHVETTDNSTAITTVFASSNDQAYQCWAQVIGLMNDGTVGGGWVLSASFRNDGGTLVKIGTTTVIAEHENNVNWNSTISQDGSENIRIEVTGDTGQTVDWTTFMRILITRI